MTGKKLLVADDSLTIQKVIRLALSNEGYEIHAVSDGKDAIQQISLFRPDLVLIDVSLPNKSAFEVKKEVNQLSDLGNIKFILMSSAFEKVDESLAQSVIFDARLTKPFDPAHLRQTLVEALNSTPSKKVGKTAVNPPSFLNSPTLPPPPPSFNDSEDETDETSYENFSIQEKLKDNFAEDLDEVPDDVLHEELNDVLQSPIEPEELPTLPPLPIENVSELWESDSITSQPPPMENLESDIKQLTNATLAQDQDSGISMWNEKPVGMPPTFEAMNEMSNSNLTIEPPPFNFSPQIEIKIEEKKVVEESQISTEEIEKLIQLQVQKSLEKIAKTMLPSLAEKIIKEEIHRMLSDSDARL